MTSKSFTATHVSPKFEVPMVQNVSTMLVSLDVDALKMNLLLGVGDDFANIKLQELIKKAYVGSQGDLAGEFANDGSKVWLTRRRLALL